MKPIQINCIKELQSLLAALTEDYKYAESIFRQRSRLFDDLTQHQMVYAASPSFWMLTFRAHDDAALFRLARIYDQHRSAMSLVRLLLTVRENRASLATRGCHFYWQIVVLAVCVGLILGLQVLGLWKHESKRYNGTARILALCILVASLLAIGSTGYQILRDPGLLKESSQTDERLTLLALVKAAWLADADATWLTGVKTGECEHA
ncbi:MAG: hypothetical protein HY646_01270 [Acidobacteria bacterium]|nr:hypothetical protein [Acidobacteriota bacterium]